jgi:hypothetical protein
VYAVAVLNRTAAEAFTDPQGRPYFLWDCDLTVTEFEDRLRDPDPAVRAYFLAKVMRQAKPDDVFRFVTLQRIRAMWPALESQLGRARPFWSWLLEQWADQ